MVWFNEQEADLEKPALTIDGELYITFVDLVRHLGGVLNWGPEDSYIEVGVSGTPAASTSSMFFPKGVAVYGVPLNATHLAHIRDTTNGRISITRLT